jgi:hypothetical protein
MQDVYLMSAKETTFFRAVYTRHSNFGMGEIAQSFDTNPQLGRSNIQTTFARSGDLMGEVYLQFTLNPIIYQVNDLAVSDSADAKLNISNYFAHYTNGVGYVAMNWNSVRIGQHEFDKQTGELMFLREQLSAKSDRQISENVGYLAEHPSQHVALAKAALVPQTMAVPLQFWFNNHVEQALPMIALYWHDMMVYLEFKTTAQLIEQSLEFQRRVTAGTQALPAGPSDFQWLANFYFLDRPERSMFANQKQEIVFGQVQYFGDSTVSAASTLLTMPIRFNHPVVDLTFVLQQAAAVGTLTGYGAASTYTTANNQWLNFDGPEYIAVNGYTAAFGLSGTSTFTTTNSALNFLAAEPAVALQIYLNNQQRTENLPWKFLRECVPARNYTRIPREAKCAVYSFGVDADNLLSTGTVNFSRLDTAEARISLWGNTARQGVGSVTGATSFTAGAPVTVLASTSLGWDGRAICYARNFNLAKVSLGMMVCFLLHQHNLFFTNTITTNRVLNSLHKKAARRRKLRGWELRDYLCCFYFCNFNKKNFIFHQTVSVEFFLIRQKNSCSLQENSVSYTRVHEGTGVT